MENDRGLSPKAYVSKECSQILGNLILLAILLATWSLRFRSNRQACGLLVEKAGVVKIVRVRWFLGPKIGRGLNKRASL